MSYVWVALGGAIGSVARYGCAGSRRALRRHHVPVRYVVRERGGVVSRSASSRPLLRADGRPLVAGDARAFLIVGVLGGFTTFSSFSVDTLNLARSGALAAAGANVFASVVLCLVAVTLGYYVVATLQR